MKYQRKMKWLPFETSTIAYLFLGIDFFLPRVAACKSCCIWCPSKWINVINHFNSSRVHTHLCLLKNWSAIKPRIAPLLSSSMVLLLLPWRNLPHSLTLHTQFCQLPDSVSTSRIWAHVKALWRYLCLFIPCLNWGDILCFCLIILDSNNFAPDTLSQCPDGEVGPRCSRVP